MNRSVQRDQLRHANPIERADAEFCDAVIARANFDSHVPARYITMLRELTEAATHEITVRLGDREPDRAVAAHLLSIATRVIDTVPLDLLDEVETALLVESARRWPDRTTEALEAAKRVALVYYADFWPNSPPPLIGAAARFGLIAKVLPAPIFLASSEKRITFSSHALDRLLNLIQGEAERFTMTDLFGSHLNVGRDDPTTVELATDTGYRRLAITVIPIETDVGTEYFGFVDDRSREHRLEEMRDDVVTAVSHQLRTPLTVIMGYLGLLTDGDIPVRETAVVLETVHRQADDLLSLVSAIVEFSKLTAGTAHLKPARQRLTVTIHSVLTDVDTDSRPIINVPHDVEVVADPDRLEQLLRIVLDNASKHGGPDVSIQARNVISGTEIIISDDGPGVPAEINMTTARPYLSVEATPDGHSLGLGLAIARGIMAAHNGTLTVENEERTAVTMWFPDH